MSSLFPSQNFPPPKKKKDQKQSNPHLLRRNVESWWHFEHWIRFACCAPLASAYSESLASKLFESSPLSTEEQTLVLLAMTVPGDESKIIQPQYSPTKWLQNLSCFCREGKRKRYPATLGNMLLPQLNQRSTSTCKRLKPNFKQNCESSQVAPHNPLVSVHTFTMWGTTGIEDTRRMAWSQEICPNILKHIQLNSSSLLQLSQLNTKFLRCYSGIRYHYVSLLNRASRGLRMIQPGPAERPSMGSSKSSLHEGLPGVRWCWRRSTTWKGNHLLVQLESKKWGKCWVFFFYYRL